MLRFSDRIFMHSNLHNIIFCSGIADLFIHAFTSKISGILQNIIFSKVLKIKEIRSISTIILNF